jgi:hypothetical protein
MSVWFAIPSARPVVEVNACTAKWRAKGYKIALWRDKDESPEPLADLLLVGTSPYPGYAATVNILAKHVLAMDADCNWVCTAGDDTEPDQRDPAEIAVECTAHFGGTFGVMQPTGDPFAGRCIERIAGSPWLGRDWCFRAHDSEGPFYAAFTHMFGDEALKGIAEKLGVYWPRPDLTHFHNHFTRVGDESKHSNVPDHLKWCNSPQHWAEAQALFNRLKASGFAECMPA